MSKQKVLLGMSGGIDSSISALILLEQGFEVIGVHFRFIDDDTEEQSINFFSKKLGINSFTIDVRQEFRDKIINYYVDEYLAGRTPFPCAKCNNELKWKLMFQYADKFDCQFVSMGHYVRKVYEDGFWFVKEGIDSNKDQSFFLWGLSQPQLERIIFPLGEMTKQEVKKIAQQKGIQNIIEKKESVGVCFCPSNYRDFLKKELIKREKTISKGFFFDEKGNKLGEHNGYPFYTIGQRRGLNLNLNKAVFVKEIYPNTNRIILASLDNMYKTNFYVSNYHLINAELLVNDFSVIVRIRYRKQNTPCNIKILSTKKIKVELAEPLESIASGQSAVFYKEKKVIGGGYIV